MKNKIFRLEEMLDSMRDSLDNLNSVIAQQSSLLDVVAASAAAEDFDAFMQELKTQMSALESQNISLTERTNKLEKFIVFAKTNEEFSEMTTSLLDALGVFGEE